MRNKIPIFGLCYLLMTGYSPTLYSSTSNVDSASVKLGTTSEHSQANLEEDKRRRVRPRVPRHPGHRPPRHRPPPRYPYPRPIPRPRPIPFPFPIYVTRTCEVGYKVYQRAPFVRFFRGVASSRWSWDARRQACYQALNACIHYKRYYHHNQGLCIQLHN